MHISGPKRKTTTEKKEEKDITMASTEDKPANKESTSSWKDSIYNPRTGELLGRTASSWGKKPTIHRGFNQKICYDIHAAVI